MIQLTWREVLAVTGATPLQGDADRRLRGVSTDTRTLERDDLFLALSGPNFDGNRFAAEALARGASGLLLRAPDGAELPGAPDGAGSRPVSTGGTLGGSPRGAAGFIDLPQGLPRDANVALCPSPRRALADLAGWHRRRLAARVVGITGSCGKTTTKNILVELLADHCGVVGSPASFNNDVGVPHTLLMADERTEVLVVEMGTNAAGEIAGLCGTAEPSGGIITNVGASHLAGLGSLEGVAREKGELAAALPSDGFCVLNADCRWTPTLRDKTLARVITFSVDGDGDLDATDVWFHAGGTTLRLNREHELTMPLLGLHAVQNLLAALAACVGLGQLGLGVDLDRVLPAVSRLRDGRRRMERIEAGGVTLFDDSYNSNPESARAAVRVLSGLHGHARRVLVLGDMLELGDFAPELHHQVGRDAAEAGVDLLLLVGELSRATAAGALEHGLGADRVVHFAALEDALEVIPGLVRDGDVALVKGSRSTGLERLVARICELRGGPPEDDRG